jgi:glycosyltransferase involved in cell wall biosynthesis
MTSPRILCAWTQDGVLARRSGYHVLAEYLHAETRVAPRCDPPGGVALWRTRLMRRMAFSRWCVGGSFTLDQQIRAMLRSGFQGVLHYLWCDRDFAFLDLWPKPAGVRLVGTFHHPAEQLQEIIRRPRSLARFDAIILMSETQRSWFLQQGVEASRLHCILHGVDVDFFTPAATRSGAADGTVTALAVGATGRNFPLLAEMARQFASEPRLRFRIIAPPHEQGHFTGMPNVTCLSGLSDAELLGEYQRATCLLHLVNTATANNVVLESLACGTPVIGQSVGGLAEYLAPEVSRLTRAGDREALAGSLTAVLQQPEVFATMRPAARAHAEALSWTHIAEQTRALYAEVG